MPWGAVAGATLVSGYMQSNAAKDAAETQANAAGHAADLQMQQYDQNVERMKPYTEVGTQALTPLKNFLGIGDATDPATYGQLTKSFTPADFMANVDPGYQWRKDQGQQALQNSQAATSGVLSGAALKDLLKYNQDMASTEYGNAFNRYQTQQGNIFARLANLATLGQNAAAGVGAQGTQAAAQAGQAMMSGAQASAAGTVGAANAWSNALSNTAGAYQYNDTLKRLGYP